MFGREKELLPHVPYVGLHLTNDGIGLQTFAIRGSDLDQYRTVFDLLAAELEDPGTVHLSPKSAFMERTPSRMKASFFFFDLLLSQPRQVASTMLNWN